jgi:hypothetical protein
VRSIDKMLVAMHTQEFVKVLQGKNVSKYDTRKSSIAFPRVDGDGEVCAYEWSHGTCLRSGNVIWMTI